jgi:hypothetical protein
MVIRPTLPVAIVSGAYAMTHHCVYDRAERPMRAGCLRPSSSVRTCVIVPAAARRPLAGSPIAPRLPTPPHAAGRLRSMGCQRPRSSWTFAEALGGIVAKGRETRGRGLIS